MVLLKDCCFWFSVRLGSIMTGCIALVASSVLLTFSIIWTEKSVETVKDVDELEELSGADGLFRTIIRNKIYTTSLAVFSAILILSSVLLIIGAFKCIPRLMYPFAITYLAFIILMLIYHIALMISLKDDGLGNLILYSNAGGFLILYLLYTWACVVSFIQIIFDLRKHIQKRKNLLGDNGNTQTVHGIQIHSAYLGHHYIN